MGWHFFLCFCFPLNSCDGPVNVRVPWKQRHVCFPQEAEEEDPGSTKRGDGVSELKKLHCDWLAAARHVIRWVFPLVSQVSANTDSSMSGYLYKSKCDKKQGKRQWFVIKDKVLYTYAASEVRADVHRSYFCCCTCKAVRGALSPRQISLRTIRVGLDLDFVLTGLFQCLTIAFDRLHAGRCGLEESASARLWAEGGIAPVAAIQALPQKDALFCFQSRRCPNGTEVQCYKCCSERSYSMTEM